MKNEIKTTAIPYKENKINTNTSHPMNAKDLKEKIINYAISVHSQGNISEAAKYYQFCIDQNYKDPRVFSNYGIIYQASGQINKAIELYKQSIKLFPNKPEAYSNFGKACQDLGKLKEAKSLLLKAISLNPNLAEYHYNLGNILNELGKIQEAERYLRKAIVLKPDYALAYSKLGNMLQSIGKSKEAETSLRKALELNTNLLEANYNLGHILLTSGKLREAEIFAQKAIKVNTNYSSAYSLLGIIFNSQGQPDKAEKTLRKAIKANPNNLNAIYNLGSTLINIRKKKEGKGLLEKLISLEKDKDITLRRSDFQKLRAKAIEKLIHCLFHEGEFQNAIQLLKNLTGEYRNSYMLGCLLGVNKSEDFFSLYKIIETQGICNSLIGSIVDHANIIYNEQINSTFCNKAIDYITHKKLKEEELSTELINQLIDLIDKENNNERVRNGLNDISKTTGNIFSLELPFISRLKLLIEDQLKSYRLKYQYSKEGFIKYWPKNYHLGGWVLKTKSGGLLAPHMHEGSWISGSFYLTVPKLRRENEGGIAFSPKGPNYPCKEKIFPEKIINIESRDLCLFPSSLFHYTIPFKSQEERICIVFDMIPD